MLVAVTIGLALLLSLAALAWVLWPLLDKSPAPVLVDDDRLADLIGRKESVIAAIRDLEFDYRVGKLTEEDFQRYDQRLRRQAIVLMQQIEQIAPASTEMDKSIEAEIVRHRRIQDGAGVAASVAAQVTAVPTASVVAAAPVAAAIAPASVARAATITLPANGSTPRFCTNCGQPVQPEHKFCANCGTAINA